ncbi:NUDIX hydrolase [Streptomyces sennicomposti]
MTITRGLAVDWVSLTGRKTPPAPMFPGELLHVFDGGVWDDDQIAAIRPAPGEIDDIEFVEPAHLPAGRVPRPLALVVARGRHDPQAITHHVRRVERLANTRHRNMRAQQSRGRTPQEAA